MYEPSAVDAKASFLDRVTEEDKSPDLEARKRRYARDLFKFLANPNYKVQRSTADWDHFSGGRLEVRFNKEAPAVELDPILKSVLVDKAVSTATGAKQGC